MKCLLVVVFLVLISTVFGQNILSEISTNKKNLPYHELVDQLLQYSHQLRQPHLPKEQSEITAQYNHLKQKYQDTTLQYIAQHPNMDTSGLMVLSYYFDVQKDSIFLRNALNQFRKGNVHNSYVQYIVEELNGLDSAKVGKVIPQFEIGDIDGNKIHMPQNQKMLIVFWASWCIPCRAESRMLKKQYAQIKEKGIEICSINLDNKVNDWKTASLQDQLPWLNYFAGKGFYSRIARFFTIHQIPQNVYVDENGKILSRNIKINNLFKD